ncbi:MAG: hypothetical protein JW705_00295, partial [Methanosarcinaceae archaeon]|nr:hypothetical protein [Methanosarcinaceae archaeon]
MKNYRLYRIPAEGDPRNAVLYLLLASNSGTGAKRADIFTSARDGIENFEQVTNKTGLDHAHHTC